MAGEPSGRIAGDSRLFRHALLAALLSMATVFGVLRTSSRTAAAPASSPSASSPSASTPPATALERRPLDATAMHALAQVSTVRVAGRTCDGLITGSGFVVDGSLLTNRHLTVGADTVKVDDPTEPVFRSIQRRAAELDLALSESVPVLPLRWAGADPADGDPVWMFGHGGGGPVQAEPARVITIVPDGSFGLGGPVLMLEGATGLGFSGGPVVDAHGDVVGVLQGLDLTTGAALAIPVSAVVDWVDVTSSDELVQDSPCPVDR